MNYKDFTLGDWIGHLSGAIEDYRELDGNEMRDLVEFLTTLKQEPKAGHCLGEVNKDMKLGRKQALEEVYEGIRDLFNWRIRLHNRDFDNAKDERYKYDLTRDAHEFNANFNMTLDHIKRLIDKESE